MSIEFGTDGWRGIMAKDFTFSNLEKVTRAIASYLHEVKRDKKIIIGYDNRFMSDQFAYKAAEVLVDEGIDAYITVSATPTPVVAYAVKEMKADGAIMITASHNPPEHNGLKFIPYYAGPALPKITDRITEIIKLLPEKVESKCQKGKINYIDPKDNYFNHVKTIVDIDIIAKSGLKIIIDPMYGAGVNYLDKFLESLGLEVKAINNYRDVLFGGEMPEPKPDLLGELASEIKQLGFDLGIALDGDADRLAIIDSSLNFISPNEIISLLMKYMIEVKGFGGCVARTVATTHMIDKIANKYAIEVIETPVGFKYIGQKMMVDNAFIGGEESGGVGIANHVPEKDGLLAALMTIEMIAKYKKTPTELLTKITNEFGLIYSERLDIRCSEELKKEILEEMEILEVQYLAGKKIIEKIDIDGMKFIFEDSSWVLVRPSGTEAVFRIYAEGENKEEVDNIHKAMCEKLNLDYNK